MSAELFAADLVMREKLISLVVSGCKHLVDWFPNMVWCMSTPHAPTPAHVGMWPWQSLRTPQERSLLLWSTYRLRRRGPRSHIRQYVAALRELCIAVRVQLLSCGEGGIFLHRLVAMSQRKDNHRYLDCARVPVLLKIGCLE